MVQKCKNLLAKFEEQQKMINFNWEKGLSGLDGKGSHPECERHGFDSHLEPKFSQS